MTEWELMGINGGIGTDGNVLGVFVGHKFCAVCLNMLSTCDLICGCHPVWTHGAVFSNTQLL